MAELRQLLARRPRRQGPIVLASMAGLAAVLAVLVAPPLMRERPGPSTLERASVALGFVEADLPLEAVAPRDGAQLRDPDRSFTWRAVSANAVYRFTIQDTSGGVLFGAQLSDTTVALPGTVTLEVGGAYYWVVEARLDDGRSTKSGLIRFTRR